MSHVWTWTHANPGLATLILISLILAISNTLTTISQHILIGWKVFIAPSPIIDQVEVIEGDEDTENDEDTEDNEDTEEYGGKDESLAEIKKNPVQSSSESKSLPTRFDRINNS